MMITAAAGYSPSAMEVVVTEHNERSGKTGAAQSDLGTELNRLGENLGKILKVPWESDERKAVEKELRSGLEQFSKQINSAIEQAKADQSVKKARDTIREAWQTAHGPQVLNEIHLGLIDSLKKLNDEIAQRTAPKPAQEVHADGQPAPAQEQAVPANEAVAEGSPPESSVKPE